MRTAARVLAVGWWLELKILSRSAFNGILQVAWPLFFATIALLLARGRGEAALVGAAVGASVMGVWSSTSTPASALVQRERDQGTLELLVAAPAPFPVTLAALPLAMATVGAYGVVATLVWARVLFGVSLRLDRPLLLVLAVAVTVVAVGLLGFLLALASVRYRSAWALGNALEYPVWLIGGFLVPLSALPAWVRPLSWALAPTWGLQAIREAALGGPVWPALAGCAALGAAYAAIGVLLSRVLLRSARESAALALS